MPRERAGFLPLMRTVHTANSTGVVDFPTEPAKRNNLSARFCFANQKPWNCRDAVHPNSKICAIFDTFKHNCASFNPYVGVRFSLMTLFFAFVLNFECAFLTLAHRRRMDGYTVKSAALPYRAREPRLYNRNRTIILNLSATFAAIRLCVCFCVGSSTSPETSKRKLSCDKWIMVVFVGGGGRERDSLMVFSCDTWETSPNASSSYRGDYDDEEEDDGNAWQTGGVCKHKTLQARISWNPT